MSGTALRGRKAWRGIALRCVARNGGEKALHCIARNGGILTAPSLCSASREASPRHGHPRGFTHRSSDRGAWGLPHRLGDPAIATHAGVLGWFDSGGPIPRLHRTDAWHYI
jgi:hypothetical protein